MPLSPNDSPPSPDRSNSAQLVESTIQRSSQIATLPAVAAEIIRLSEDPETTIEDLNKVIITDPVLGVRILKLVNSAYYGLPGQIKSIKHAILLLGLKAVKNAAIAASLVKMVRGGVIGSNFDATALWIHSIAVATGAQMLAQRTELVAADEAFLAGLIHDMGILVEMQAFGPKFAQMIQSLTADDDLTFRAAEESVLGASHEAFGAGLCKSWNFPPSLQYVTGYHHRPWGLAEEYRVLPTLVHIADVLAARLGLGYARTVETETVDPQLLASVNLTEIDLQEISAALPEAMQESQRLMSEGG